MTPSYETNHLDFDESRQNQGDEKLAVLFYKRAIKNESKTIEAGRPIYDELDYIKILTPGSRDTFETEVTEEYRRRFPAHWAKFKANQEQSVSGTPLDQVPWLTLGQVAELRAVNVNSVEALVGMPDNLAQKFMGAHELKRRAQAFLDAAKDAAPLLKMQEELHKRDEQIAELRSMVEAQAAAMKTTKAKSSLI